METKEQLVQQIKGWMANDNEMRELQSRLKELKEKRKGFSDNLVEIMRKNEIDCFDVNDGKLIYTKTKVKANYLGDPELSGYHVSTSYSLTGEMREYNHKSGVFSPMPVAHSVYQNGWGAWELSARYSVFDGKDEQLDAGSTDIFSLGVSWWLSSKFNVNFNYRWIDLDRQSFIDNTPNLHGSSSGFSTRIVLFL